jgi:transcriptional regulator with XRE-family HTH domain
MIIESLDFHVFTENTISSREKFIKELRAELQISQSQLSERLNIDQATVSRWERGLVEPHYEMRRHLHEMAVHSGLWVLEDLTNLVNFSPFPMILVDRSQKVYAASIKSGFKTKEAVTDQTPPEERAFLQAFIERLEVAGFWEGRCRKFDYQFPADGETRSAIVMPVRIHGDIFALVQKAW